MRRAARRRAAGAAGGAAVGAAAAAASATEPSLLLPGRRAPRGAPARPAMPAYHSAYNAAAAEELCGVPVLPLRTRVRGPAPCLDAPDAGFVAGADAPDADAVDEALRLFRANMLFRNFDLQGGGDRLLVYATLFIHACLKRVARAGGGALPRADAARDLGAYAAGAHVAPGEPGWPLAGVIAPPKSAAEGEAFKAYLRQIRETVVARLLGAAWDEKGVPSKHWFAYAKRKGFMCAGLGGRRRARASGRRGAAWVLRPSPFPLPTPSFNRRGKEFAS
jgi:actin related protein 2/3 complex subunit 3